MRYMFQLPGARIGRLVGWKRYIVIVLADASLREGGDCSDIIRTFWNGRYIFIRYHPEYLCILTSLRAFEYP